MKLKEIKKILIPVDFSETSLLAIEHGRILAKMLKADVILLHCDEKAAASHAAMDAETEVVDKGGSGSGKRLDELASSFEKEDKVNVISMVKKAKPSRGIVKTVEENNIDLIVMGTHGIGGFEEFFMGSTAHKIVNLSPCPVLSVQTHASPTRFGTIVLPIDDTMQSRQKVVMALSIASAFKATVHLLGLPLDHHPEQIKKFNVKLDTVEDRIKQAGLPFVRKVIQADNVAVEVMKYSDEVKADLTVIMTDHESHLTGIFLGAFAGQIVNHSKVPVLSIRPSEAKLEASA